MQLNEKTECIWDAKKEKKRADSAINSSGQKNRQEKDEGVQGKEETTMKRAKRAAEQENDKRYLRRKWQKREDRCGNMKVVKNQDKCGNIEKRTENEKHYGTTIKTNDTKMQEGTQKIFHFYFGAARNPENNQ